MKIFKKENDEEQTIKHSARRFNLAALTEYLNYAGWCGGIKVTSPRYLISLTHLPKDEQYLQQACVYQDRWLDQ